MLVDALEPYESEYRARQIRLGSWIAVGITVLGGVRILADWETDRWLIVPIAVAAVAQAVLGLLSWRRIVRWRHLPAALIGWWSTSLALLFAFAAFDEGVLVLYPIGAALVASSACAISGPRTVLGLGLASLAGYLLLAPGQPHANVTLVLGTTAMIASVVGFCVMTAANRRRLDAVRRAAELRTEALLENASDAVIVVTADGQVTYASPSVRGVLGYEPDWLNTDRLSDITHPDHLVTVREWVAGVYASPPNHVSRIESRTRRADGTWINVEVTGANRTTDPSLRAAVLSVRDISSHKALEEELTRQAFEDPLTGMPNRALFHNRLAHAIARNRRSGGRITMLLVDLDDFKMVNDTLGHAAGDTLLTTSALRLHQQLRPADTLARLGGDEFAILVEDVDEVEALELADRLLKALRRPVRLENRDLVCTASMGIATVKAGGETDEPDTGELLRNADLAMYAAKAAGRDRCALFDPSMHSDIMREAEARSDLERALLNEEFVVFYQPIVDLPTSRLIGVEALLRWQHPQRGLIGPYSFISLAETTGLIVPLGRWVLQQACGQLAAWCAEFPAALDLRVSINLSPRQFQHTGLVEEVAEILDTSGVNPAQIVLEITESLLMHDADGTVDMLRRLKALGLRLAIDDFGTGYSSLSYLKRFPVDILKIDRSFVDGIATGSGDATLAEAVVQLGRALQLQTVAEGIETTEQWSTLQDLGCDLGQGYLFAKPSEAAQIASLLTPYPKEGPPVNVSRGKGGPS